MGFGSWVRRLRDGVRGGVLRGGVLPESLRWDDVRGDRPLAGLIGTPDRHPPEQSHSWPTPLSPDRLAAWFARHDFSFFVDDDGDLGGIWHGRLFYFFCFGEHSEILQVRGQWNREIALERLPEGHSSLTIAHRPSTAAAARRDPGVVFIGR